jgi:4-hydroxybenzoate polyprenyltransferase
MRLNKPIGIWLFLWPTMWALWLAAGGFPPFKILCIFISGVFIMRSAGCVINDIWDRKFDRYVRRTKERPLVKGELNLKQAIICFVLMSLIAVFLALQLNVLTLKIAVIVFLFTMLYPLTKRWIYFPQIILGMTVASAVPMVFASIQNKITTHAWVVFSAALIWPLIYDTIYALVDRQDDIKIGVKSTAIYMGDQFLWVIAVLQFFLIGLFIVIGINFSLHWPYYSSVVITVPMFIRQLWLIRSGIPEACFKVFLESHWVGFMILLGIINSSLVNVAK